MTYREYIKSIGIVFLGLLFLVMVNPLNMSLYGGYLLIAAFVVFKVKSTIHLFDSDFIILSIFTISYTLFLALGENAGVQFLIMQMVFPPFFYIIGKYINRDRLDVNKKIILLLIIGFALSFSSMLSVLKNIAEKGFVNVERNVADIFTGTEVLATLMAANLMYNLTIPGVLIANRKNFNLFTIIVASGIFMLSMLCMFRLGSRTGIVVALLCLLSTIGYTMLQQNLKQNIRFTASLIVISVLVFKFVPFDLEADYLSVLGDRLTNDTSTSSASAGGRTELWSEAIGNIFKHPFGWKSSHFAHNTWLDTARVSGVIPFIFLIVFTGMNVRNLRLLIKKNKEIGINITLILFTLVNLLVFFVEPILEGSILIFCVYCLFQGFVKRTIELADNKTRQ